MNKTYAFLDAIGIQAYIFATNRLSIILGSSLALARWQQDCANACTSGEIVVSAGGNVLASFDDASYAQNFRVKCINMAPPGLEIAWAEATAANSDAETWALLQKEISKFKAGDRDPSHYGTPIAPGFPGCMHCGLRPKGSSIKIDDKETCDTCAALHQLSNSLLSEKKAGESTPLERLFALPKSLGFTSVFPTDLDKLVTRKGKDDGTKDELALVVIDINNMGNRIKELVRKPDGFNNLKRFSEQVDKSVYDVFENSINKLAGDPRGHFENEFIRLRPLMLAGDDSVFALPAPLWPDFVTTALLDLQTRGFPACAGIAVAKHTFPISRVADLAENLVRSAKGLVRFRKVQNPTNDDAAVDWHVHQESAFTNLQDVRRRKHTRKIPAQPEFEISTRRPYTLEEFLNLQKEAKKLTGSSRKLFALHKALLSGADETRDTLVHVFLRNENDSLTRYKSVWDLFPGNKPLWETHTAPASAPSAIIRDTLVPDILELKWFMEPETEVRR